MYRLITELYPICRSMTGDGVRTTLDLLRAHVPITVHEARPGLQLLTLPEDDYEGGIDSSLQPGYLTWGEVLLRGRSLQEVLISCHICHPSLRNDNLSAVSNDTLSGIAVAAALAQRLLLERTRYSYRFLFISSTIGSVTWLALNHFRLLRIKHSLLLDCLGGSSTPNYNKSRSGDAEIDRAVAFVLKETTCADDLTFVEPRYLHDSFMKLRAVIDVLEDNRTYMNRSLHCEPEPSNYRLTRLLGRATDGEYRRALLWVLNSSDGSKSLLDIASEGNLGWDAAKEAACGLVARGLITPIDAPRRLQPPRKRRVNRSLN